MRIGACGKGKHDRFEIHTRESVPDPSERTPTILVVEDEILIRIALVDYLQDCGFKVLGVSSGDEAILMLGESGVEVDLVFSDVQMPGKTDGFALAHWIRANRPGLPIILTSGDPNQPLGNRSGIERGAD